jgi:hypothetical protein
MAVLHTCCTAGPRRLRRPSADGRVQDHSLEERLPPPDADERPAATPASSSTPNSVPVARRKNTTASVLLPTTLAHPAAQVSFGKSRRYEVASAR